MKKTLSLFLALLMLLVSFPFAQAASQKTFTLMIYMCGTDLESQSGAATADLKEMVSAGIQKNGNVTVYIQTGGTKTWHVSGITNRNVERWTLSSSGLMQVDSVGSADMGKASTFTDFLKFGFENFPADRYGLIMWDHGSGASGGLCYDEMSMDALYYPELYQGLTAAKKCSNYSDFAFIGFDACLMGSYELALLLKPFTRYMIASEEVEPGAGWVYDKWLPTLVKNPAVDIPTLGKAIVDSFISSASSSYYQGDYATLSVCDLSKLDTVSEAVEALGSSLYQEVSGGSYSTIAKLRANVRSFGELSSSTATDMLDLGVVADVFAQYNKAAAKKLTSGLSEVVIYSKYTRNLSNICGLSILMPYSTRSSFNTYMPYYDPENLSPNYTAFVKAMVNKLSGGYSTGSLSSVGISQSSVENAQIDWFGQYADDQSTYNNTAGSYWGDWGSFWGYGSGSSSSSSSSTGSSSSSSSYGSSSTSGSSWGNQSSSGSSFTLGDLLGAIFGDSSSGGYNFDYDSSSSNLWGYLGDDSDLSFANNSGYGSSSSSSYTASDALGQFLTDILSEGIASPQKSETPSRVNTSSFNIVVDGREITLNNPFADSQSKTAYMTILSPEQLHDLAHVEANLMLDVSDPGFDCWVELGYVQNVIVDWGRGHIYGLFDGKWATLEGQMVAMVDQIANEHYVRSLIPALINGEKQYLIVLFDEENPDGRVAGYTRGYNEAGYVWRGSSELKEGDVILPEYKLIYWDENGNQQEEVFYSETEIIVGSDCTLSFGFEPVEAGGNYLYGFCLTDIYGESSFTSFLSLDY